jgi:hypothetical protein
VAEQEDDACADGRAAVTSPRGSGTIAPVVARSSLAPRSDGPASRWAPVTRRVERPGLPERPCPQGFLPNARTARSRRQRHPVPSDTAPGRAGRCAASVGHASTTPPGHGRYAVSTARPIRQPAGHRRSRGAACPRPGQGPGRTPSPDRADRSWSGRGCPARRPDWFTKLSRLECGAAWGVWRRLTFLVAGVGVCVASARAHL